MKPTVLLIALIFCLNAFSQNDSTVIRDTAVINVDSETAVKTSPQEPEGFKIFYGQRLINTNTVEVLRKGVMEFRVVHNFDDAAGDRGGIKNFFGLDNSTDVRIGFQLGLFKNFNVIAARAKGTARPNQLWELGIKHQLLRQEPHDPKHAFSITWFANVVTSTVKADTANSIIRENHFTNFSDRMSQLVQLIFAKKIGTVSLQFQPTYVHRNFVIPGDDNSIFALGGGIRLPITKGLVLIADYSHPFRSQTSRNAYAARGTHFYDPFGVGFEILTWGHVFHLNFTNTYEILDNKILTYTTTRWEKGQFRWGFMLSRNFTIFKDKKQQ